MAVMLLMQQYDHTMSEFGLLLDVLYKRELRQLGMYMYLQSVGGTLSSVPFHLSSMED